MHRTAWPPRRLAICALVALAVWLRAGASDAAPDPFADGVQAYSPGTNGGFGADLLPDIVLGAPHGAGAIQGSFDVLALGIGGSIVLRFDLPVICDAPGADFTVFENAFHSGSEAGPIFTEYGYIAVSQDGQQFFELPYNATSGAGLAGRTPVFSNPDNDISPLDPAVSGGDTFDLADVGLAWAAYVRITDVAGAIHDTGDLPQFTVAPNAGFDLDAVAALHACDPSAINSPTPTFTATVPIATPTATRTPTAIPTATLSPSATSTPPPTPSPTPSITPTSTPSPPPTPSVTATWTATPSGTATVSATRTPTSTASHSPTETAITTATVTPTSTPTIASSTPTATPTDPSAMPTTTADLSTASPTATHTATASIAAPTATETPTAPVDTPTTNPTDTQTAVPDTPSATPRHTPTATPLDTPTIVPLDTPTDTPIAPDTPTQTPVDTPALATPTVTPTAPTALAGDLDGDGAITTADAAWLIAELYDGDGDATQAAGGGGIASGPTADVNGDGRLTVADLAGLAARRAR